MNEINTKKIGDIGENEAAKYLIRNGYTILERQYRVGHCEIDIIAEDKHFTVFVEVKTRTADRFWGRPATAVTYTKQTHLLHAAHEWLRKHPDHKQPRMDVIEIYLLGTKHQVLPDSTVHIRNAFGEHHS